MHFASSGPVVGSQWSVVTRRVLGVRALRSAPCALLFVVSSHSQVLGVRALRFALDGPLSRGLVVTRRV